MHHMPVMVNECIEGLAIRPSGIYVDATFGRGGHSRAILNRLDTNGRLLAIDKDPQAITEANQCFASDQRFNIEQCSFKNLLPLVNQYGWLGQVNGILLDLGVSSPQIDSAERGFSFQLDGPLDMRMDPTVGLSAAEWLQDASEQEIIFVLRHFGEEKFAKRIARAIVESRDNQPIETTSQLAAIVSEAMPVHERHKHPATRTFQAIRIAINEELEDLKAILVQAMDVLAVGGRLVVMSFHSLEDRIVKQFFERESKGDEHPADLPIRNSELNPTLKLIKKKIRATRVEVEQNNRARSAILRIAEKIA